MFSSLCLEHLARCALSSVHPALLADARREENILYAFGIAHGNVAPVSISAHTVYSRCGHAIPAFSELVRFCQGLAERRNEEFHSSGEPFEAILLEPDWLQKTYRSMSVLCEFLGKGLADLLGEEEAALGDRIIVEADADTRSSVDKRIKRLAAISRVADAGHSVVAAGEWDWPAMAPGVEFEFLNCPACGVRARAYGDRVSDTVTRSAGGTVVEADTYIRSVFACVSCGLGLAGQAELDAAGLAGYFTTETETAAEAFYSDRASARELHVASVSLSSGVLAPVVLRSHNVNEADTAAPRGSFSDSYLHDEALNQAIYRFPTESDAENFYRWMTEHHPSASFDLQADGTIVELTNYSDLDTYSRRTIQSMSREFEGERLDA